MASNRVLAKSINMPFLQSNNKFIYVSLLVVLSFFLLLDYVPGMHAYSAWVTPPLALFLGLAFALLCGQAHPKFNKKTSKYLLYGAQNETYIEGWEKKTSNLLIYKRLCKI